jgi:hypothetical protein
MEWFVRLSGDQKLLNKLTLYLTKEEALIKTRGNDFYLYSKYFNNSKDDIEFNGVATELIKLINGAASLLLDTNRKINFNSIGSIDESGNYEEGIFIRGSANVEKPLEAKKVDILSKNGNNAIIEWVKKGYYDKRIKILSELLDDVSSKWILLYNRAELVKKDLDGWEKLFERGWCKKSKIKLFKNTSQSYDAIGPEARHISNYKKIKNPMKFEEARELVRAINIKWVYGILNN